MTQAEIANHTETSERFLRHAEEQFERGDLPQASEKAWGAVAHYVKSVAKQRGWRDRSHSDLSDIVVDLAQETDDPERIKILYRSVGALAHKFLRELALRFDGWRWDRRRLGIDLPTGEPNEATCQPTSIADGKAWALKVPE